VLCIFDRAAIENPQQAETLLRIFGARAAAELERLQAMEAIQGLNATLEERVNQRTEELLRSERDLRTIFNNVYDAIFIHDLDGVMLDVNDRALELHDATREQLLAATAPDLSAPGMPIEQIPEILQRVGAGETLRFEWRDRRLSDNVTFDVELSLRQVILGDRTVVIACMHDISDRKQAEADLRDSEARFRAIFEQAAVGMIQANAKGQFIQMNQQFCNIVGYSAAELFLKDFGEITHPDDVTASHAYINRLLSGESSTFVMEKRYIRPDGGIVWANLSVSLVRNTTGEPQYLIAAIKDISDRKRLEQELRQMNAELEQRVEERTLDLQHAMQAAEAANRAKSVFLANMSHELRTPLNAILGFAQLISRDLTLDPGKRNQLQIINRSGEHLLSLINDILEMAKIEAGRTNFLPRCFDLYALLKTLEEMFQIQAIEKGLQFIFDYDLLVIRHVETDEKKLRQVLINLIGNAIKFTPTGSVTLHVQAENINDGEDHSNSKSLTFEIIDTGFGISPDELEQLFEPFTQSNNRQVSQDGTGLGLPISRQFVQLLGGDLTVQSTLGVGSTFAFTIPVQLADAANLSTSSTLGHILGLAPNQLPYRILVVEDNDTNQQLLVQLLQSIGFEVQAVPNGQDAIAVWQHWQPQLIWMDMRMPVMNGYEATGQIRALEQKSGRDNGQPPTIIIGLTANVFEEERAKMLQIGCNDFVRKPFQIATLLEKIAEYLGVQYRYAEVEPTGSRNAAGSADSFDAIAALKTLPASLLTQLHQATIRLDNQRLSKLIPQIATYQPQLAALLTEKSDNFDLEPILMLLQEVIQT